MQQSMATRMKAPFRSRKDIVQFLRAPEGNEGHVTVGDAKWSNKDLEPTPVEQRTWTWYNLPMYWFSAKFSIVGWNTGSSLITIGLTWQQSFISVCIGAFLTAIVVVLMGRPGARYHIGFPVLARATMGMYGSYFFVAIRAVVCIIWYGIQTYYAGNILSVMFRCVFGHKWSDIPNTLPASGAITSQALLAFFLAWIIQFPFAWVHPSRIRHIFTIKGITQPIAAFALFGWCMAIGGGLSTLGLATASRKASSVPVGWQIMSGINSIFGSLSPMLVNQPDLARYCKKPRDAGALQGVAVFFPAILVMFMGMASTTSIQGVWGEAYWNVWDMFDAILDHYWSAGSRTAIFFVGLTFFFGTFVTNFSANSIPFGADLSGLAPKWMTIRRGQILCAILGIVVQPWQLMANAPAFLSFLGSYNIFMAPLCAVLIADYFIIRKGNIHIPSCYDGRPFGLYWYWSGFNLCGIVAWALGTTMGIPGLIGQYQPQVISNAAKYMYMMGWLLTFATSATIYYAVSSFIRPQVFPTGRHGSFAWEWLAKEGRDGFFEDEVDGGVLFAPPTPPAAGSEEFHVGEKGEQKS